jgi:Fe-Mn family superoxide dismutase
LPGTEYEQKDIKNILLATAREPTQAPIFNHASMAHNNHFFFKNLSPRPVAMPSSFKKALEDSFSSVETLRREFVVMAAAMFGPGFVWLVRTQGPSAGAGHPHGYRLLTTYLAGSPYPGAHWRRQGVDMNAVGGASPEAQDAAGRWLAHQQAVGRGTAEWKRTAPGGVDVVPLLCLNTWEHVWLRDYGLGAGGYGGKRAFVEAWWEAVDWEAVGEAASVARPALKR